MDLIPFINKNGLWYVDMPELIVNHITFKEPDFITERNMIELLDTLAKKNLSQLHLEFHYDYINPYDAKLVKTGNTYTCVSIFYRERNSFLSFPPILERAMKSCNNSKLVYIRVFSLSEKE